MSNKTLEKLFQIVSAILIGIAAFFWWRENNDLAFIPGVLAVVSFFLSYRYRLKEGIESNAIERYERELEEMNMNRNLLKENKSLFDVEEETGFEKVKEKILNNQ